MIGVEKIIRGLSDAQRLAMLGRLTPHLSRPETFVKTKKALMEKGLWDRYGTTKLGKAVVQRLREMERARA